MGRYQRVTVLGETSDSLPVSSGIPQASIFGPMLFLIYVNNLPDSVLTSHVAMFADDTKTYKQIKFQEDAAYLRAFFFFFFFFFFLFFFFFCNCFLFLFLKPTVLQKYQQVPTTSRITNINYKKSTHTDERGAYRKKLPQKKTIIIS